MLPIRQVLHPTDFSDLSRPAFELACALARDYRAELTVLHVSLPPIAAVADGLLVELPTGWEEETRARLNQVRPADPRLPVTHRLEQGEPSTEILKVAAELPADLVVMGTHGRGGLSRLLIGSVAEVVMRKASCPVLTVRTPAARGRVTEAPAAGQPASGWGD